MPKHIDLDKFIAQQIEEDSIEVTAGSKTFTIPPELLWPDDLLTMPKSDQAKALLGNDYDAFIKAGGTDAMVIYFVNNRTELESVGESPAS